MMVGCDFDIVLNLEWLVFMVLDVSIVGYLVFLLIVLLIVVMLVCVVFVYFSWCFAWLSAVWLFAVHWVYGVFVWRIVVCVLFVVCCLRVVVDRRC